MKSLKQKPERKRAFFKTLEKLYSYLRMEVAPLPFLLLCGEAYLCGYFVFQLQAPYLSKALCVVQFLMASVIIFLFYLTEPKEPSSTLEPLVF